MVGSSKGSSESLPHGECQYYSKMKRKKETFLLNRTVSFSQKISLTEVNAAKK